MRSTWDRHQPGVPKYKTAEQGAGPVVARGANIHPEVYAAICAAAEAYGIKYQTEVVAANTGTDAWAMQVTRSGVPTGLLSLPLAYMHSQVETVDLNDIGETGRLLAAFAAEADIERIRGGSVYLSELSALRGVSGNEAAVRTYISEQIRGLVDEMWVDPMGNLFARKGTHLSGPHVMLAAHMDEVGLLVTHIEDDGLLRFDPVGGIDHRVLPSVWVQVGDRPSRVSSAPRPFT